MMFTNVHESYGVTRTRRTTTGYTFIRAIAQDLQGSHHLNAITIHVVVVAIQLSGAYRAIPEPKRPFQRAKPTILTARNAGCRRPFILKSLAYVKVSCCAEL